MDFVFENDFESVLDETAEKGSCYKLQHDSLERFLQSCVRVENSGELLFSSVNAVDWVRQRWDMN